MSIEPRIQYARTSDGVNIAFSIAGEGERLPVLWLPTIPFAHAQLSWTFTTFGPYFRALSAQRPFAMLDLRGQGLSDRKASETSLAALHRDVEAVVDKAGWKRFAVVGSFSGGLLGMSFAQQHPELVARLILIGPRPPGSHADADADTQGLSGLLDANWDMYIDALVRRVYGWTDAEFNREMVAFCHQSATQASAQALFRAMAEIDLASAIATVDSPTLVLHAEGAGFSSIETSRGLAAGLRNGRLATFDASAGFDMVGGLPFVERFLDEEDGRSSATPAPLESADAHPSGGTRTILFTDIVGHTEMMWRLGDAKGREVLREHERITRDLLKQHGGAEVKTMGDGFMASFGSVTSAMECAIALQRAFAAHTDSMPEPLHVRVGLNAGEPIEEDGDLFGATVILASRIAAKASAGEILVPDTVRGLLSGKGFVFGDRGEFVPKGFDEGVRLWDVRWQENE